MRNQSEILLTERLAFDFLSLSLRSSSMTQVDVFIDEINSRPTRGLSISTLDWSIDDEKCLNNNKRTREATRGVGEKVCGSFFFVCQRCQRQLTSFLSVGFAPSLSLCKDPITLTICFPLYHLLLYSRFLSSIKCFLLSRHQALHKIKTMMTTTNVTDRSADELKNSGREAEMKWKTLSKQFTHLQGLRLNTSTTITKEATHASSIDELQYPVH